MAGGGARPYRAVLFDFFGTLTTAVRRGPAHDAIARRLGCRPAAYTSVLDETFFARCVGALGDPATTLATVAARAGGRPSREDVRAALRERVDAVAADTTLRPEAVPVLRALRRMGLRTAVVSDCGPELPELLVRLPVAVLLDASVFSIELGRHKPDAMMYLTACVRVGVHPADCLYVGDGDSHELSGAVAAGLDAVRLAAPDLGGHLAFGADHGWTGPSVASLAELPQLLGSGSRVRPWSTVATASRAGAPAGR
jgi:putative hydrolase of the HAD superfamily